MNKKEFIIVLTITFIVIMIWIISDIYHTKASIPTDPKVQETLEPLDPSLDTETLELIKNPPTTNIPIVSTPIPTPTPIATGSATPKTTP